MTRPNLRRSSEIHRDRWNILDALMIIILEIKVPKSDFSGSTRKIWNIRAEL